MTLEDFHLDFVDSLDDVSMPDQQIFLHKPIVLPEESTPNCRLAMTSGAWLSCPLSCWVADVNALPEVLTKYHLKGRSDALAARLPLNHRFPRIADFQALLSYERLGRLTICLPLGMRSTSLLPQMSMHALVWRVVPGRVAECAKSMKSPFANAHGHLGMLLPCVCVYYARG